MKFSRFNLQIRKYVLWFSLFSLYCFTVTILYNLHVNNDNMKPSMSPILRLGDINIYKENISMKIFKIYL